MIRIDSLNPGHFFACCGLLEVAHRLQPAVMGSFDNETFRLDGASVPAIVEALAEARVQTSGDAMVALGLRIDWWMRARAMKTWAGQQRPAVIWEDLRQALGGIVVAGPHKDAGVLDTCRPLSGRFGFDPSASIQAIDVGFSPDDENEKVDTSPLVELLACIGLQRCQPIDLGEWQYAYHLWAHPIFASLMPAAAAGAFGGRRRQYTMEPRGQFYRVPTFSTDETEEQ
jgi:CRISPR-associated protein Csb3